MTAPISISVFHQWLLDEASSNSSACAIILHVAESRPADRLIHEITDYLNEYDDDGDGRWLPATPELVSNVANDPNHRRLLGMSDRPAEAADDDVGELQKTLRALGNRGHVVLRSAGMMEDALETSYTFRAGVGNADEITHNCHIILNPDLMNQKCIAHIIGDVFLEWLHCETRRDALIHDIR